MRANTKTVKNICSSLKTEVIAIVHSVKREIFEGENFRGWLSLKHFAN